MSNEEILENLRLEKNRASTMNKPYWIGYEKAIDFAIALLQTSKLVDDFSKSVNSASDYAPELFQNLNNENGKKN